MKICAIICEFNPFHNGHAYIIREARRLSKCDYLICVMSGQFTQRGDMCRTDKFLRAKHAILAGADAVVELPAPFAVAPAEIFAKGAIKLISRMDGELSLCFGSENMKSEQFLTAATALSWESDLFKKLLAEKLAEGMSYIKSYASAFEALGGDPTVLSSPNNILGVEYCKAAIPCKELIQLITVPRVCKEGFAPAHTIRKNWEVGGEVKAFMPDYSYNDYILNQDRTARFNQACADAIFFGDKEKIKRVYGCSEGLDNRLKKLATESGGDYGKIIEKATNRRYSAARIRRIMTANLLHLYSDDTDLFLNSELELKVLAVKKDTTDQVLPLLSRPIDCDVQSKMCYEISSAAYSVWRYLSEPTFYKNENEKMILV